MALEPKSNSNFPPLPRYPPIPPANSNPVTPVQVQPQQPTPKAKEIVKDYNKDPNRNAGYKLVKRKWDIFWKVFAIFCIFLAGLSVYLFYDSLYDGKFSGIIENHINPEINNNYDFNPSTENQFDNEFIIDNEFINEFNFELTEEFIEVICGE